PTVERRSQATKDLSPGSTYTSLSGVRVLVVDDEADARELIAVLLRQCGASVVVAASAAEGLETLKREKFDCLLSDIEMPKMDGYNFIRQVREWEQQGDGRKIPAAAL